jgi:hypothetical protein
MIRHLLALLAFAALLLVAAGPAQARLIDIGPDLANTPPATIALSDPNDVVWWDGAPGIRVRQKGEIRAIKIKGGTVQSAAARRAARAADRNYDIAHWIVLRKKAGTWRAVSSSEDVRLPILGRNGIGEGNVSIIRQPKDQYRVCARKGDRVALAGVGGYVAGAFDQGLPFQVFSPVASAVTQQFRAGGLIRFNTTKLRARPKQGVQLQMQAVLGTGKDARPTCR